MTQSVEGRGSTQSTAVRAGGGSNLEFFSLALAWGLTLHLTSEADWFATPFHTAVTLVAIFVLLRPKSIIGLGFLAASWVGAWLWEMPRAFNHTVLLGVILVAVPPAILLHRRRVDDAPRPLEHDFFPYVRALVYALFGFAVLHKLNADYLEPAWSCAVEHVEYFFDRIPILPTVELDGIGGVLIVGSLAVEGLIPVLLFFSKTRTLGLALAFGFHYFNGLNGHWAFSAPAMALYVAFLPPGTWQRVRDRVTSFRMGPAILVGLAVAMVGLPVVGSVAPWAAQRLGLLIYLGVAAPVMALILWEVRGRHEPFRGRVQGWQRFLVGAVVLLGLSPYLGLGTRGNFAMYSNLQTEGTEWNHLFMPEGLRVFDLQDRLIALDPESFEALEEHIDAPDSKMTRTQPHGQPLLVGFEFRRVIGAFCAENAGPLPLSYTVDGVGATSEDMCANEEWSQGPGTLLSKALRFRLVETPSVCRQ
jgi:hypothetical protein